MFEFCVNRLSMLFVLMYIFCVSKAKYPKYKTISFLMGTFILTMGLDYAFCLISVQGYHIFHAILNATFVVGTTYLVSTYKDIRPYTIAMVANCLVLTGHVMGIITYAYCDNVAIALLVQVIITGAVYAFHRISIQTEWEATMEKGDSNIGLVAVLISLFYVTILSMVYWPQNISEHLDGVVSVIILMILMIVTMFVTVRLFSKIPSQKYVNTNNAHIINTADHSYKSTIQLYFRVMIFSLICILVFMAYVFLDNNRYKKALQRLDFSDCSPEAMFAHDLQVDLVRRGNAMDSWEKEVHPKSGNIFLLDAHTYDLTITNMEEDPSDDWYIEMTIPQDLYLNKAWCGTILIHQTTNSGEKVQELDLRNVAFEDVTVDYIEGESDLLIPLKKGDIIKYYPNPTVYEKPINASNLVTDEYGKVTIGFIFYYDKDVEVLPFDNGAIYYQMEKRIETRTDFWVGVGLGILWLICFMFFVGFQVRSRSDAKAREKDKLIIQEILSTVTSLIDAKDSYTAGHSERVALYSRMIAQKMDFSDDEILHIYYSAQLHDCGKIGIPEGILNKPGRLTDDEFVVIKEHTIRGYNTLKYLQTIPSAAVAARHHHERYDGKGYPDGLKGKEIPVVARIVCVADAFDAMNSSRVYRAKLERAKIIEQLVNGKGTQFDADIVDIMLELIEEGKIENI